MKSVGFTGTSRRPVTVEQITSLVRVLGKLKRQGFTELVHGEAKGADTLANNTAKKMGYRTIGRPSSIHESRVKTDLSYPPEQPLRRNKVIVLTTSRLIAMPHGPEVVGRAGGGEWATVRYARKAKRPVMIIWPDGTITEEP